MSRPVKWAAAILASFVLIACSPTSSNNAVVPPDPSSITCQGQGCEYDNQEIKTTLCPEPAVDASTDRVSAESLGIKADVVVRKSAAKGLSCDRLYWAKLDMSRFQGNPNQKPYVLSLTVSNKAGSSHTVTQESDNPSSEALTRTIKVSEDMLRQGLTMTACVAPGGSIEQVCVAVKVV